MSPTGGCSPSSLSGATFPDHESQSSIHLLPLSTELNLSPPYNFPPPDPPSNTPRAEESTQEKFEQHQTPAAKMAQTSRNINYRPDFKMCGKFSGEQGSSAEKWLRKFEYDMHGLRDIEGNISPSDYLTSIEILLADQAEILAESTPQVPEILYKAPDATRDDVTTLQLLFRLQYPGRAPESTNLNVDAEISKLSQQASENLGTYYKRASSLLIQAGSRDRETPLMIVRVALKGNFTPLSPSENTVLDSVIRAFIRGISDTTVRADTLRGLVMTQRSLRGAYTIAEESKKLKEELALMEKLEHEQDELEFLRRVVKDQVSSEPISKLMKWYTGKNSPPLYRPTTHSTRVYPSTF